MAIHKYADVQNMHTTTCRTRLAAHCIAYRYRCSNIREHICQIMARRGQRQPSNCMPTATDLPKSFCCAISPSTHNRRNNSVQTKRVRNIYNDQLSRSAQLNTQTSISTSNLPGKRPLRNPVVLQIFSLGRRAPNGFTIRQFGHGMWAISTAKNLPYVNTTIHTCRSRCIVQI